MKKLLAFGFLLTANGQQLIAFFDTLKLHS